MGIIVSCAEQSFLQLVQLPFGITTCTLCLFVDEHEQNLGGSFVMLFNISAIHFNMREKYVMPQVLGTLHRHKAGVSFYAQCF